MKTMKAWLGATLAVLALALGGCDPFEEQGDLGGAPRLIRAGAFDIRHVTEPTYVDAADNGVAVLTADVILEAVADDPATPTVDESAPEDLNQTVIELQFSALLDGASVQRAAPDPVTGGEDCTPVGLTITPAAPAGQGWFTCYDSTAGASDHRGRIFVFRNANGPTDDPGDFTTATLDPGVAYRIVGSVRAENGTQIPVDVTVNTQ
jgi:hypothetical protein